MLNVGHCKPHTIEYSSLAQMNTDEMTWDNSIAWGCWGHSAVITNSSKDWDIFHNRMSWSLSLKTSNKTEAFLCCACVCANKYLDDRQVLNSQQQNEYKYIYSVFSGIVRSPNLFLLDEEERKLKIINCINLKLKSGVYIFCWCSAHTLIKSQGKKHMLFSKIANSHLQK